MNAFKPSLLFAALFAVGLAGCDRNDDDVAGAPDLVPPAATEPDIDMPPPAGVDLPPAGGEGVLTLGMHDDGGNYVVDSAGSALYMLEGDEDGSGCTDDCTEVWPPLLVNDVQASIDPATTLDAGMLGRIERADGTTQVTYNGHPLYRYAADTGANRTAGHGLQDQWGHWYLVTPEGEEFEAGDGAAADAPEDREASIRTGY